MKSLQGICMNRHWNRNLGSSPHLSWDADLRFFGIVIANAERRHNERMLLPASCRSGAADSRNSAFERQRHTRTSTCAELANSLYAFGPTRMLRRFWFESSEVVQ